MKGLLQVLLLAAVAGFSAAPEIDAASSRAPDFTLRTLDNNEVTLSELRGKVVFIDFWATWCPPCRLSMPAVEKLHEKFKGEDVIILGINVDGDPKAVQRFITKKNVRYTVLLDDERTARSYGVSGIPALFIIGPDGVLAKRYVGYMPGMENEWEREIRGLLKTAPKASPSPKNLQIKK